MNGIWILLLLILTASLPGIIVFFWLRSRKSAVTLSWFLASMTAGIVSLLAAALIQRFFPPERDGLWHLFFGVFIRIALVEELSRIIALLPLFIAGNHIKKTCVSSETQHRQSTDISFGAALGLVSGLGFAIIESAFHGMSDISITLLRAFTAAPLHGACGIRAGIAVFTFTRNKSKAFLFFISAVLIHGAYNLMIVSPAIPSLLAIPVALAALLASLTYIRNTDRNGENNFVATTERP